LLRHDFPLTVIGETDPGDVSADRTDRLRWTTDWAALLADPELTGIVIAVPQDQRVERICAALRAGKSVLVEGLPAMNVTELARIEAAISTSGQRIGSFFARGEDADFAAAKFACRSGRLGQLRQINWIGSEYALPADNPQVMVPDDPEQTFREVGGWLIRQLLLIVEESPHTIQAWNLAATAGLQIRVECPSGMSAWLESHRAAFSGLRTGWVVEGTLGAYRDGRLMTLVADGELRSEPLLPPETDRNVWTELRRLLDQPEAARRSWRQSSQTVSLLHDCRASIHSGRPIVCSEIH